MGRVLPVCLALCSVLLLAFPASGSAATTVGALSVPNQGCAPDLATRVQVATPSGPSYEIPAAGVITSWSTRTSAEAPPSLRLRVMGPASTPNSYTTLGTSSLEPVAASTLSTFPTRIPVAAGGLLGLSAVGSPLGGFDCATVSSSGFTIAVREDDPGLGSTDAYITIGPPVRLSVSAQLEPDVDGDGFGDETQDQCPENAALQVACPIGTTITKAPPRKAKRKRATIEFSSDRAGATFECALDGSAFAACTSPFIKTVSKGNHAFQVRAVSPTGKVDDSPAVAQWTVKKKRKKHKH